MIQFRSRQLIPVLVAFSVAAGGLLVPGSALAEIALFRIENRWHNFPNPAITTPGNAGLAMGWVIPYVYSDGKGNPVSPPGTAQVEPGNPIGGAFTLPSGFIRVDS